MHDAEQYDVIRQQVERHYTMRQNLIKDIAAFIITNGILWVLFGRDSWALWITFVWGIMLFFKVFEYYNNYGPGAHHKEQQIQREVQREIARQTGYEKPKNDSRMRLTDDGEVEEVPDAGDEELLAAKPKRR